MAAANLRHGLVAVEAACDDSFQSLHFERVVRINHALGEFAQLVTTELPRAGKFKGMLNYSDLILRWQIVHRLNNFGCGHGSNLGNCGQTSRAGLK